MKHKTKKEANKLADDIFNPKNKYYLERAILLVGARLLGKDKEFSKKVIKTFEAIKREKGFLKKRLSEFIQEK